MGTLKDTSNCSLEEHFLAKVSNGKWIALCKISNKSYIFTLS